MPTFTVANTAVHLRCRNRPPPATQSSTLDHPRRRARANHGCPLPRTLDVLLWPRHDRHPSLGVPRTNDDLTPNWIRPAQLLSTPGARWSSVRVTVCLRVRLGPVSYTHL